nr:DNA circularization N-terminal domain-containing protein [Acetobacter fallax]
MSTASWRGVTFFMPSSQSSAGRRLVQLLFPGSDTWRVQDFGKAPQTIRIRGLIIGDDYVIRAKRMAAALEKSGPATLIHPWFGTVQARLLEPASISFSDGEIRLARFEATFLREQAASTSGGLFSQIASTIDSVLTSADDLVDQATMVVQSVLSPLNVGLALAGAAQGVVSQVSGVWDALVGSSPVAVQAAALSGQTALAAGVTAPTTNADTSWADSVTEVLSDVPSSIANAAIPTDTSAVAASVAVVGDVSDDVDVTTAVTLLLTAAVQIGAAGTAAAASSVVPGNVLALSLAARVLTVSQAMAAQTAQVYASQPDALTARDTMLAALAGVEADLDAAMSVATVPLMALGFSVQNARTQVTADISAQLGRLPALVTVTTGCPVNAWAVAYAVAGDTPSDVASIWDDLVTRNDLIHPALAGPGDVMVLEPSS